MSISVDSFAEPRLQNLVGFIHAPNKPCFYIPLYQRSFTWEHEHRELFIQDLAEGLQELCATDGADSADAVTFFGALIFYLNNDVDSVFPSTDSTVGPPDDSLMGIIDGQQRMTMLMLTATVLHDAIHQHVQDDAPAWLTDLANDALTELSTLFEITRRDAPLYPRIAREAMDVWAKAPDKWQYISPLSRYIHHYSVHRQAVPLGESIVAPTLADMKKREYKHMYNAVAHMQKQIAEFCGNSEEMVNAFLSTKAIGKALSMKWSAALAEQQLAPAQNAQVSAIMLAHYLLHCAYFVVINTNTEVFAYDIFQSLNTRGQSLTPYETFHPLIIQDKNNGILGAATADVAVADAEKIKKFLDKLSKEADRERTTVNMVQSFALLKFGDKLSRRFNAQRKYLEGKYDQIGKSHGGAGKVEFVRHMRHVADWMRFENDRDIDELPGAFGEIAQRDTNKRAVSEALFAMSFIRQIKHLISHGILGRFYVEAYNSATEDAHEENFRTLIAAIKSCAAFFALMRAAGIPANRVENCHRLIMKGIPANRLENYHPDIAKMKEGLHIAKGAPINLANLQAAFIATLHSEVVAKLQDLRIEGGDDLPLYDVWLKATHRTNIYDDARLVAKFLIMIATHDADSDENGRLIRSEDLAPIVGDDAWGDDCYKTVEHIIPQGTGTSEEELSIHLLGNLTLLPQRVNSILSARDWPERKAIYAAFSARNAVEKDNARTALASFRAPDGARRFDDDKIEKFVSNGRPNLRMTRALSFLPEFGMEQLQARHNNLAELAWQTLATDWLNYRP